MPRIITWALATQRGVAYNPTFLFNEIQLYLNFIAEYKDLLFVRVSNYASSRIKFLNAPVRVMETNIPSFTTYISSYFNFGRNRGLCCRFTGHEFLHMPGGARHLPQPHIMSANAGTVGNYTEHDYAYLAPYANKSARRPWLEPNRMRDTFKQLSFQEDLPEKWSTQESEIVVPDCICSGCGDDYHQSSVVPFTVADDDIDDTLAFVNGDVIDNMVLEYGDDPYP